jgi:sugar lactone lactonase YvrE
MKRRLLIAATVLLAMVGALAAVMKARYGGRTIPFPDRTARALLGNDAVTVAATLDEPPGNIAVAPDGRIFFTYHPEARPPLKVLELVNGNPVPWPSEEWQERFGTVLSLRIDRQGRLWTLDTGFHGVRRPLLIAFDLKTGKRVHQWRMPREVAGIGSYVQDFAVDPEGRWIYLADISVIAKRPALIVYDTRTRNAWRALERDASVLERPYRIVARGKPMIFFGGLYAMHPAVDSIALDENGEWLYYGPMSHDTLFRVRTSELRAGHPPPRVEVFGPKPQTDGIGIDAAGNLYMTEVEHGTIALLRADRSLHTLVRDPRIRWPDGVSFGPDGSLYVTDSALGEVLLQTRGRIGDARPFHIFRVRPDTPPR